ncbi:MAG TPA: hypothetical protein PLY68_03810 [Myxococcota bacterium]|nr:hypothetical protein [Myxococcota bacterium]HOD07309.1 hypothetical protein [Myxococcota bacterium]HPB50393.1 hypothetical protein [Myxococcota bacterium]HQP95307.1 hypothetical protein [Myxococcota bacterium]
MNIFESLSSMVGRLSGRERRLVGLLGLALSLVIVAGAWFGVSAVFSGIREDIEADRKILIDLKAMAPSYIENRNRRRAVEEAVKGNKDSVRVMANEILKDIELSESVSGAMGTRLADIVSFEGKTVETPVDLVKSRKASKAKKKTASGYIQEEQTLEFKEVPHADLMRFLDAVEKSESLLFVTKVEMSRKFNDKNRVRSSVGISTFRYSETSVKAE